MHAHRRPSSNRSRTRDRPERTYARKARLRLGVYGRLRKGAAPRGCVLRFDTRRLTRQAYNEALGSIDG